MAQETLQAPPDETAQRGRPGRWFGAGITGAGALAAFTLPLWRPGVGWLVAALGLVAVVVLVRLQSRRRRGPAAPTGGDHGERAWRVAAAAAGLLLVAVAAVRAAEWLVALCLCTAFLLGSYALTGGRSWRAVAFGAVALPWASARRLREVTVGARTARERPAEKRPARERPAGERTAGDQSAWRPLVGLGVGIGLLVVFGALLRSADPVFAERLRQWTPSLSLPEVVRATVAFVLTVTVALGAAYAATTRRRPRTSPADTVGRRLRRPDWAIPLALLNLLFGAFVWVQLTVLFAGHGYVLRPGGPDYAVYARNGFGQLLAVTALTLAVVAVVARWAGRSDPTERLLLRVLGGVLCAFTLVIVASALRRMGLLADAYGFTRNRLIADAVELWLGIVFVLLLVAGVRLRAAWLPRAVVAAGVVVLIGLAALNPDAYIARSVVERLDKDGYLDSAYLSHLSPDAVAAIDRLPEPARSCALRAHRERLRHRTPAREWNAGRERARSLAARQVPLGPYDCPTPNYPTYPLRVTVMAPPGAAVADLERVLGRAFTDAVPVQPRVAVDSVWPMNQNEVLESLRSAHGDPHRLVVTDASLLNGVGAAGYPDLFGAAPIATLASEPLAVVVPVGSKYQTLTQFMDDWRRAPTSVRPGGGAGMPRVLAGLLAKAAGVDPRQDYRFGEDGLVDDADVSIVGAYEATGLVRQGQARLLAVSAATGTELAGVHVPSVRESGYDVELLNWLGVLAPPGLGQDDRAAIVRLVTQMHDQPSWRAEVQRRGWRDDFTTGDAAAARFAGHMTLISDIYHDLGWV